MAGHSKWANIKHRKAAQDAKKGQTTAKLTREIIMASKLGGPEPEGNFRLRTAIEKAKTAGVAKNTIELAIEKGQGKSNSDNLEALTYEGYGPGGVAILIEATTDNRNRTAGDIRSYFNKYQGNLGETGCVGWMFEEKGLIVIDKSNPITEEELLNIGLDYELEDLEDQDESFILTITPDNTGALSQILQQRGIELEQAEIARQAINQVEISDPEHLKTLQKLLDAIESHDDVEAVYSNAIY